LEAAIREGALLRVRPKAMTIAVILAGLTPILIGHGAGSEVMSRIAAPMVGCMLTAPLLSMLVIPAGCGGGFWRSPLTPQPQAVVNVFAVGFRLPRLRERERGRPVQVREAA
jgi:hypothetical protein